MIHLYSEKKRELIFFLTSLMNVKVICMAMAAYNCTSLGLDLSWGRRVVVFRRGSGRGRLRSVVRISHESSYIKAVLRGKRMPFFIKNFEWAYFFNVMCFLIILRT